MSFPRVFNRLLLLQHGADPLLPDADGRLPLHWCMGNPNPDILSVLLKTSSNLDIKCVSKNVGIQSHLTPTLLSYSACHILHPLSCLTQLVSARDAWGMTPLMWACFLNRPKMVKKLLKHGAELLEKDNDGRTAMHWVKWLSLARSTLTFQPLLLTYA